MHALLSQVRLRVHNIAATCQADLTRIADLRNCEEGEDESEEVEQGLLDVARCKTRQDTAADLKGELAA